MARRPRTEMLVIHVTATSRTTRLTTAALRAMHKARGFSDIGYNEWIDQDGKLQPGRGVDQVGAHVAGYNSISYGISLEGGRDVFDISDAQMETLETRLRVICERYPDAKICGHRDLSPDGDGDGVIEPHEHIKACPRFDAIPWAQSKGLPAADIKGVWETHSGAGPDARVRWLQGLLRNIGYPVGPVDGWAGARTEAAIKLFQDDSRLAQTGDFDKPTVAALRARAGA